MTRNSGCFDERRAHPRRALAAAVAGLMCVLAGAGLLVAAEVGAGGAPAGAREEFLEAHRAYAEGRLPDAVRLYEAVIRRGSPPLEASFNLGSVHLRAGRPGPAVLNYRRAWHLAPRDPDVQAALRLALRTTGAPEPDLGGAEIAFTQLSRREWATVATVAWWALWLCLSAAVLVRRRKGLLRRAAVACGAVAGVALLGLWVWGGFERRPELVVLKEAQSALSAPADSSSPRFPLPEGSVVRLRGYQGAWAEVASGQLTGWIRREVVADPASSSN